ISSGSAGSALGGAGVSATTGVGAVGAAGAAAGAALSTTDGVTTGAGVGAGLGVSARRLTAAGASSGLALSSQPASAAAPRSTNVVRRDILVDLVKRMDFHLLGAPLGRPTPTALASRVPSGKCREAHKNAGACVRVDARPRCRASRRGHTPS